MPINIALLTASGLGTTKNDVLGKLYGEALEYKGIAQPLTPIARDRAIKLLDKIMKHAAVYLTSKPPQAGKVKNQARWDALTDLATQAVTESRALGVKLLTSPADFRNIKFNPNLGAQSYWLERVDPQHRAGFLLSKKYETWIQGGSATYAKSTFWDFADTEAMDKVLFIKEGDLDGHGLPVRECYRVTFDARGFAFNNDGTPFTTRHMQTAHSGNGWGVFVVDPNGKLYARSHQVGYFHHSTFLAGRPVAAAPQPGARPIPHLAFEVLRRPVESGLGSMITVEDRPRQAASGVAGRRQRVDDQVGAHVLGDCPPGQPPGVTVDHGGQVEVRPVGDREVDTPRGSAVKRRPVPVCR